MSLNRSSVQKVRVPHLLSEHKSPIKAKVCCNITSGPPAYFTCDLGPKCEIVSQKSAGDDEGGNLFTSFKFFVMF